MILTVFSRFTFVHNNFAFDCRNKVGKPQNTQNTQNETAEIMTHSKTGQFKFLIRFPEWDEGRIE